MTKQMTLQEIRDALDTYFHPNVIDGVIQTSAIKEAKEAFRTVKALDTLIESIPDGLGEAIERIENNLIEYGAFTVGFQSNYDIKNVKETVKLLHDMKGE